MTPEKCFCRNKAQHLKKTEGFVNHHWSYNKDHAKDVIMLSKRDHKIWHKNSKYDSELFMYRDTNGILMDTRQKAISWMIYLKATVNHPIGVYPVLDYEIK